ncbi:MAG TPA: sulfate permease [Saprospiraceae bacterium]|nr:sulfate permease [Saprospiraceae bacterium]HMQ84589.1 sulfate permease [Saprospiraceae bacterium]
MNGLAYFPLLEQLKGYNRVAFKGDLIAGLTVWILLIPQTMAYAMLAGMPPIYGLYGGLIPPLMYGLLGTARQLSLGPVASSSLVILAGISQVAAPESAYYIEIVILTGFLIGVGMLILGLFRLGFLAVLLSQPVIVGFTAAAGVIIGVSQLKYLFGIPTPHFGHVFEIILYTIQHLGETHWLSFAFCSGSVLLMLGIKRFFPKIPSTLAVSVLSILLTYWFRLDLLGLEIVKDVPQGLPHFVMPGFETEKLNDVIATVLVGIVIGVVESISIAKALEIKSKTYKINPSQELVAAGAARALGGLFQSLPTSASFTRSALNRESGAQTGMASVIMVIMTGLTLLFLTPLVYYMPKAVLGAIVFMAVRSLIDFKAARHLWHTHKRDFAMMLATFLATLFISIELGVATGVALSLLLVLYQSSRPHIAILGQLPNSREFRNVNRFPEAHQFDGVVIARFDAPLFFLNADYFSDFVQESVKSCTEDCQLFVLDGSSMTDIDSTGLRALEEAYRDLSRQNTAFYLAGLIGPVRDRLNKSGLAEKIGADHQFLNVYEAVQSYLLQEKNNQEGIYWSEAAIQHNEKTNKKP